MLYIYTYIHTYLQTYTHTHIYIHIYRVRVNPNPNPLNRLGTTVGGGRRQGGPCACVGRPLRYMRKANLPIAVH